MLKHIIEKIILSTIFKVDLTSIEQSIIRDSIEKKYTPAVKKAFFMCMFSIFPILFLDTSVVVSVLIPITMVCGSAWFSISLASIRQKFGKFGLEMTANMFEAFSIALGILFLIVVVSFLKPFIGPVMESVPYRAYVDFFALIVGVVVIGNMVYKLFIGSLKYDINDAMLTGQNEAAERFFRKSLSILHNVSSRLQDSKSLPIANYYIGVAFFEIYSFIKVIDAADPCLEKHINNANKLIKNPTMDKKQADSVSYELVTTFVGYCKNPATREAQKSLKAIQDELWCLSRNTEEPQEMTDTRLSIIFKEIADLIEGQGETLFLAK